MRSETTRPDQIGDYWLSKKPGRKEQGDPWCRTWYDKRVRQTRHVSLGTADVQEARLRLADWVFKNGKVSETNPESILIDLVLLRYWEKHGRNAINCNALKAALGQWQAFWEGRAVSDITPDEQERFRQHLGEGTLRSSTIDKILSVGRAALNFAVKRKELDTAPHIFMIETDEERRSRQPMGEPVTPELMALLSRAAKHRHHFVFMLLAATTLGRPEAILDLRRMQYDAGDQRLYLNPPGRKQTKKFRPVIPVAPTLKPWLDYETDPESHFVAFQGKRLGSITQVFTSLRADAGVEARISAYSFRHGMAREMRKRRVPLDEIGLFLGHRPKESSATTSIYAPMEPEYCTQAIAAIEEVLAEVKRLTPDVSFDNPSAFDKRIADAPRLSSRGIGSARTKELHEAILAGEPVKVLAERFGISDTAVYKHRRKLGIRWW
jgi:site-specific recombinase XerD